MSSNMKDLIIAQANEEVEARLDKPPERDAFRDAVRKAFKMFSAIATNDDYEEMFGGDAEKMYIKMCFAKIRDLYGEAPEFALLAALQSGSDAHAAAKKKVYVEAEDSGMNPHDIPDIIVDLLMKNDASFGFSLRMSSMFGLAAYQACLASGRFDWVDDDDAPA